MKSSLVSYTRISPNKNSPRNAKVDTITIHCTAGVLSIESLGEHFAKSSTSASSNYGVGEDGRIGCYVDEGDRSWASSSRANDNRAITIEVVTENKPPYRCSKSAVTALVGLLVDICKRYEIPELLWKNDKTLVGQVDKQNITLHRWFSNTDCPGDYLISVIPNIVKEVNQRLKPTVSRETLVIGGFSSAEEMEDWKYIFRRMGLTVD